MKGNESARRILVTDIGGTHSRVALFEGSPPAMRAEATVSSDAADFDAVLAGAGRAEPALFAEKAHCLVVAAAAPVTGQEVLRLTNQPWSIRRAQLAPFADAVVFINDFEAQARACAMPLMEGAVPLLPGNGGGAFSRTRLARGLCVVGAGTGLGVAFCRYDGGRLRVSPSEAGHCAAAFAAPAEREYADWLSRELGRDDLVWEDVLSGRGLESLHRFLTGDTLTAARITALPGFGSGKTCDRFARFYGRFCRDRALAGLPRGGVVITGGVAGRSPSLVRHAAFREEFLRMTPPFDAVLAAVPVWLNRDRTAGLWGAAQAGMELLDGGI